MQKNPVLLASSGASHRHAELQRVAGTGAFRPADQGGGASDTPTARRRVPPTPCAPRARCIPWPPPTACQPMVTANQNANIRNGPGTVYAPPIGNLLLGQTALVDGRNADGTWWYIVFAPGPSGHGWIAGSTVNAICIPTTVAVVAAPPTPRPASGTCKDNYVWRLIRSSDKVCVSPGSKAQADADNGAADSRLCTATYGPDTCAQGFVWRDAFSGDHVCVTGATRSQAAADNAAAGLALGRGSLRTAHLRRWFRLARSHRQPERRRVRHARHPHPGRCRQCGRGLADVHGHLRPGHVRPGLSSGAGPSAATTSA